MSSLNRSFIVVVVVRTTKIEVFGLPVSRLERVAKQDTKYKKTLNLEQATDRFINKGCGYHS